MRNFFYNLLFKYISLYIFQEDKVVSVEPVNNQLIDKYSHIKTSFINTGSNFSSDAEQISLDEIKGYGPDFILLNGTLHFEKDIQSLLQQIRKVCPSHSRLVITFYSSLWKPFLRLATFLGFRENLPEENWIAPEDVNNLLLLSDFEIIRSESRILLPLYIPVISYLLNRYISPLPIFNYLNLLNIVVAKPVSGKPPLGTQPSVSVVVAARNEEGNILNIVKRLPQMGPDDELILVEGNSTDNTWKKIQEVYEQFKTQRNIQIAQQEGKGKGDAIRKGFSMAGKDILMILDADLTVPPEDLPKFYQAIVSGKGEYINGSRLVYSMEKGAMLFFNMIGNKFFALAFSFVLGQRFKDTLCGTKVISRINYSRLAMHRSYFGDFDPFGDFDLIFGSARMCLKIVEIPIAYRKREYGDTNISRWKHGIILFRMLIFAARKIKFI